MNVNIDNGADYNEKGVTPNIGMPAEDEAESTTKATVSEGEIEIRDKENQKQDLAGLNRDTQNALNKLGEIFDKDSIEERQELAGLFGELVYKAVGDLAEKNGWKDGSAEKNALHAFVGGVMAELGSSDFLAGASGAMVNEMVQKKLAEAFKDDPAMHQWASALIGGVVSEIISGNAQAGAKTAISGTKFSRLTHKDYDEFRKEIEEAKNSPAMVLEIKKKYMDRDIQNEKILVDKIQNDPEFVAGLIQALKENPDLEVYQGVVVGGISIVRDKNLNHNLKEYVAKLPDGSEVLIHSEHPQYTSNGRTDLVDSIIDYVFPEESNLMNEVVKAYGVANIENVINKLPDKIKVNNENYTIKINGQEVLKNVTFGGVITTAQGSYEIYLDSQKYAGKDLYKATVINVGAIGLSLWTSSKINENVPEEFGYAIPLLDGGMAYLIDKGKNAVKETLISK